jgi:hypothetical protein
MKNLPKINLVYDALHGMAYYIFLKSLRSLEEFSKNPHAKIPPKSPSTNFQSLAKFKNLIFNSKILFPYFWPSRPCGPLDLWPNQPAGLTAPTGRNHPRSAHLARASVASSREYVFPFGSRLPSWPPPLISLSSGPQLSAPSPTSSRHRFPATERRPAPRLGCHRAVTTSPSFSLP